MVVCLERGADLHMAQMMPLPLAVCCFSKIQIGFTFLVPAHLCSPRQRAVKHVCVCVCVLMFIWLAWYIAKLCLWCIISVCRMTNYELLRRLVETLSRDIHHCRMLNVSVFDRAIFQYRMVTWPCITASYPNWSPLTCGILQQYLQSKRLLCRKSRRMWKADHMQINI